MAGQEIRNSNVVCYRHGKEIIYSKNVDIQRGIVPLINSKHEKTNTIKPRSPKPLQRSSKLRIENQMSTIDEETFSVSPAKSCKQKKDINVVDTVRVSHSVHETSQFTSKSSMSRTDSEESTASWSPSGTSEEMESLSLCSGKYKRNKKQTNIHSTLKSCPSTGDYVECQKRRKRHADKKRRTEIKRSLSNSDIYNQNFNVYSVHVDIPKLTKHKSIESKCAESSASLNIEKKKTNVESDKIKRPSILSCILSDIFKDDKKKSEKLKHIKEKKNKNKESSGDKNFTRKMNTIEEITSKEESYNVTKIKEIMLDSKYEKEIDKNYEYEHCKGDPIIKGNEDVKHTAHIIENTITTTKQETSHDQICEEASYDRKGAIKHKHHNKKKIEQENIKDKDLFGLNLNMGQETQMQCVNEKDNLREKDKSFDIINSMPEKKRKTVKSVKDKKPALADMNTAHTSNTSITKTCYSERFTECSLRTDEDTRENNRKTMKEFFSKDGSEAEQKKRKSRSLKELCNKRTSLGQEIKYKFTADEQIREKCSSENIKRSKSSEELSKKMEKKYFKGHKTKLKHIGNHKEMSNSHKEKSVTLKLLVESADDITTPKKRHANKTIDHAVQSRITADAKNIKNEHISKLLGDWSGEKRKRSHTFDDCFSGDISESGEILKNTYKEPRFRDRNDSMSEKEIYQFQEIEEYIQKNKQNFHNAKITNEHVEGRDTKIKQHTLGKQCHKEGNGDTTKHHKLCFVKSAHNEKMFINDDEDNLSKDRDNLGSSSHTSRKHSHKSKSLKRASINKNQATKERQKLSTDKYDRKITLPDLNMVVNEDKQNRKHKSSVKHYKSESPKKDRRHTLQTCNIADYVCNNISNYNIISKDPLVRSKLYKPLESDLQSSERNILTKSKKEKRRKIGSNLNIKESLMKMAVCGSKKKNIKLKEVMMGSDSCVSIAIKRSYNIRKCLDKEDASLENLCSCASNPRITITRDELGPMYIPPYRPKHTDADGNLSSSALTRSVNQYPSFIYADVVHTGNYVEKTYSIESIQMILETGSNHSIFGSLAEINNRSSLFGSINQNTWVSSYDSKDSFDISNQSTTNLKNEAKSVAILSDLTEANRDRVTSSFGIRNLMESLYVKPIFDKPSSFKLDPYCCMTIDTVNTIRKQIRNTGTNTDIIWTRDELTLEKFIVHKTISKAKSRGPKFSPKKLFSKNLDRKARRLSYKRQFKLNAVKSNSLVDKHQQIKTSKIPVYTGPSRSVSSENSKRPLLKGEKRSMIPTRKSKSNNIIGPNKENDQANIYIKPVLTENDVSNYLNTSMEVREEFNDAYKNMAVNLAENVLPAFNTNSMEELNKRSFVKDNNVANLEDEVIEFNFSDECDVIKKDTEKSKKKKKDKTRWLSGLFSRSFQDNKTKLSDEMSVTKSHAKTRKLKTDVKLGKNGRKLNKMNTPATTLVDDIVLVEQHLKKINSTKVNKTKNSLSNHKQKMQDLGMGFENTIGVDQTEIENLIRDKPESLNEEQNRSRSVNSKDDFIIDYKEFTANLKEKMSSETIIKEYTYDQIVDKKERTKTCDIKKKLNNEEKHGNKEDKEDSILSSLVELELNSTGKKQELILNIDKTIFTNNTCLLDDNKPNITNLNPLIINPSTNDDGLMLDNNEVCAVKSAEKKNNLKNECKKDFSKQSHEEAMEKKNNQCLPNKLLFVDVTKIEAGNLSSKHSNISVMSLQEREQTETPDNSLRSVSMHCLDAKNEPFKRKTLKKSRLPLPLRMMSNGKNMNRNISQRFTFPIEVDLKATPSKNKNGNVRNEGGETADNVSDFGQDVADTEVNKRSSKSKFRKFVKWFTFFSKLRNKSNLQCNETVCNLNSKMKLHADQNQEKELGQKSISNIECPRNFETLRDTLVSKTVSNQGELFQNFENGRTPIEYGKGIWKNSIRRDGLPYICSDIGNALRLLNFGLDDKSETHSKTPKCEIGSSDSKVHKSDQGKYNTLKIKNSDLPNLTHMLNMKFKTFLNNSTILDNLPQQDNTKENYVNLVINVDSLRLITARSNLKQDINITENDSSIKQIFLNERFQENENEEAFQNEEFGSKKVEVRSPSMEYLENSIVHKTSNNINITNPVNSVEKEIDSNRFKSFHAPVDEVIVSELKISSCIPDHKIAHSKSDSATVIQPMIDSSMHEYQEAFKSNLLKVKQSSSNDIKPVLKGIAKSNTLEQRRTRSDFTIFQQRSKQNLSNDGYKLNGQTEMKNQNINKIKYELNRFNNQSENKQENCKRENNYFNSGNKCERKDSKYRSDDSNNFRRPKNKKNSRNIESSTEWQHFKLRRNWLRRLLQKLCLCCSSKTPKDKPKDIHLFLNLTRYETIFSVVADNRINAECLEVVPFKTSNEIQELFSSPIVSESDTENWTLDFNFNMNTPQIILRASGGKNAFKKKPKAPVEERLSLHVPVVKTELGMSYFMFKSILRKFLEETDVLAMLTPCFKGQLQKAPKISSELLVNPSPVLNVVSSIECKPEEEVLLLNDSSLVIVEPDIEAEIEEAISQKPEMTSTQKLLSNLEKGGEYLYVIVHKVTPDTPEPSEPEIKKVSSVKIVVMPELPEVTGSCECVLPCSCCEDDFTLSLDPDSANNELLINFRDTEFKLTFPEKTKACKSVEGILSEIFDTLKENKSFVRKIRNVIYEKPSRTNCDVVGNFIEDVLASIIKESSTCLLHAGKIKEIESNYREVINTINIHRTSFHSILSIELSVPSASIIISTGSSIKQKMSDVSVCSKKSYVDTSTGYTTPKLETSSTSVLSIFSNESPEAQSVLNILIRDDNMEITKKEYLRLKTELRRPGRYNICSPNQAEKESSIKRKMKTSIDKNNIRKSSSKTIDVIIIKESNDIFTKSPSATVTKLDSDICLNETIIEEESSNLDPIEEMGESESNPVKDLTEINIKNRPEIKAKKSKIPKILSRTVNLKDKTKCVHSEPAVKVERFKENFNLLEKYKEKSIHMNWKLDGKKLKSALKIKDIKKNVTEKGKRCLCGNLKEETKSCPCVRKEKHPLKKNRIETRSQTKFVMFENVPPPLLSQSSLEGPKRKHRKEKHVPKYIVELERKHYNVDQVKGKVNKHSAHPKRNIFEQLKKYELNVLKSKFKHQNKLESKYHFQFTPKIEDQHAFYMSDDDEVVKNPPILWVLARKLFTRGRRIRASKRLPYNRNKPNRHSSESLARSNSSISENSAYTILSYNDTNKSTTSINTLFKNEGPKVNSKKNKEIPGKSNHSDKRKSKELDKLTESHIISLPGPHLVETDKNEKLLRRDVSPHPNLVSTGTDPMNTEKFCRCSTKIAQNKNKYLRSVNPKVNPKKTNKEKPDKVKHVKTNHSSDSLLIRATTLHSGSDLIDTDKSESPSPVCLPPHPKLVNSGKDPTNTGKVCKCNAKIAQNKTSKMHKNTEHLRPKNNTNTFKEHLKKLHCHLSKSQTNLNKGAQQKHERKFIHVRGQSPKCSMKRPDLVETGTDPIIIKKPCSCPEILNKSEKSNETVQHNEDNAKHRIADLIALKKRLFKPKKSAPGFNYCDAASRKPTSKSCACAEKHAMKRLKKLANESEVATQMSLEIDTKTEMDNNPKEDLNENEELKSKIESMDKLPLDNDTNQLEETKQEEKTEVDSIVPVNEDAAIAADTTMATSPDLNDIEKETATSVNNNLELDSKPSNTNVTMQSHEFENDKDKEKTEIKEQTAEEKLEIIRNILLGTNISPARGASPNDEAIQKLFCSCLKAIDGVDTQIPSSNNNIEPINDEVDKNKHKKGDLKMFIQRKLHHRFRHHSSEENNRKLYTTDDPNMAQKKCACAPQYEKITNALLPINSDDTNNFCKSGPSNVETELQHKNCLSREETKTCITNEKPSNSQLVKSDNLKSCIDSTTKPHICRKLQMEQDICKSLEMQNRNDNETERELKEHTYQPSISKTNVALPESVIENSKSEKENSIPISEEFVVLNEHNISTTSYFADASKSKTSLNVSTFQQLDIRSNSEVNYCTIIKTNIEEYKQDKLSSNQPKPKIEEPFCHIPEYIPGKNKTTMNTKIPEHDSFEKNENPVLKCATKNPSNTIEVGECSKNEMDCYKSALNVNPSDNLLESEDLKIKSETFNHHNSSNIYTVTIELDNPNISPYTLTTSNLDKCYRSQEIKNNDVHVALMQQNMQNLEIKSSSDTTSQVFDTDASYSQAISSLPLDTCSATISLQDIFIQQCFRRSRESIKETDNLNLTSEEVTRVIDYNEGIKNEEKTDKKRKPKIDDIKTISSNNYIKKSSEVTAGISQQSRTSKYDDEMLNVKISRCNDLTNTTNSETNTASKSRKKRKKKIQNFKIDTVINFDSNVFLDERKNDNRVCQIYKTSIENKEKRSKGKQIRSKVSKCEISSQPNNYISNGAKNDNTNGCINRPIIIKRSKHKAKIRKYRNKPTSHDVKVQTKQNSNLNIQNVDNNVEFSWDLIDCKKQFAQKDQTIASLYSLKEILEAQKKNTATEDSLSLITNFFANLLESQKIDRKDAQTGTTNNINVDADVALQTFDSRLSTIFERTEDLSSINIKNTKKDIGEIVELYKRLHAKKYSDSLTETRDKPTSLVTIYKTRKEFANSFTELTELYSSAHKKDNVFGRLGRFSNRFFKIFSRKLARNDSETGTKSQLTINSEIPSLLSSETLKIMSAKGPRQNNVNIAHQDENKKSDVTKTIQEYIVNDCIIATKYNEKSNKKIYHEECSEITRRDNSITDIRAANKRKKTSDKIISNHENNEYEMPFYTKVLNNDFRISHNNICKECESIDDTLILNKIFFEASNINCNTQQRNMLLEKHNDVTTDINAELCEINNFWNTSSKIEKYNHEKHTSDISCNTVSCAEESSLETNFTTSLFKKIKKIIHPDRSMFSDKISWSKKNTKHRNFATKHKLKSKINGHKLTKNSPEFESTSSYVSINRHTSKTENIMRNYKDLFKKIGFKMIGKFNRSSVNKVIGGNSNKISLGSTHNKSKSKSKTKLINTSPTKGLKKIHHKNTHKACSSEKIFIKKKFNPTKALKKLSSQISYDEINVSSMALENGSSLPKEYGSMTSSMKIYNFDDSEIIANSKIIEKSERNIKYVAAKEKNSEDYLDVNCRAPRRKFDYLHNIEVTNDITDSYNGKYSEYFEKVGKSNLTRSKLPKHRKHQNYNLQNEEPKYWNNFTCKDSNNLCHDLWNENHEIACNTKAASQRGKLQNWNETEVWKLIGNDRKTSSTNKYVACDKMVDSKVMDRDKKLLDNIRSTNGGSCNTEYNTWKNTNHCINQKSKRADTMLRSDQTKDRHITSKDNNLPKTRLVTIDNNTSRVFKDRAYEHLSENLKQSTCNCSNSNSNPNEAYARSDGDLKNNFRQLLDTFQESIWEKLLGKQEDQNDVASYINCTRNDYKSTNTTHGADITRNTLFQSTDWAASTNNNENILLEANNNQTFNSRNSADADTRPREDIYGSSNFEDYAENIRFEKVSDVNLKLSETMQHRTLPQLQENYREMWKRLRSFNHENDLEFDKRENHHTMPTMREEYRQEFRDNDQQEVNSPKLHNYLQADDLEPTRDVDFVDYEITKSGTHLKRNFSKDHCGLFVQHKSTDYFPVSMDNDTNMSYEEIVDPNFNAVLNYESDSNIVNNRAHLPTSCPIYDNLGIADPLLNLIPTLTLKDRSTDTLERSPTKTQHVRIKHDEKEIMPTEILNSHKNENKRNNYPLGKQQNNEIPKFLLETTTPKYYQGHVDNQMGIEQDAADDFGSDIELRNICNGYYDQKYLSPRGKTTNKRYEDNAENQIQNDSQTFIEEIPYVIEDQHRAPQMEPNITREQCNIFVRKELNEFEKHFCRNDFIPNLIFEAPFELQAISETKHAHDEKEYILSVHDYGRQPDKPRRGLKRQKKCEVCTANDTNKLCEECKKVSKKPTHNNTIVTNGLNELPINNNFNFGCDDKHKLQHSIMDRPNVPIYSLDEKHHKSRQNRLTTFPRTDTSSDINKNSFHSSPEHKSNIKSTKRHNKISKPYQFQNTHEDTQYNMQNTLKSPFSTYRQLSNAHNSETKQKMSPIIKRHNEITRSNVQGSLSQEPEPETERAGPAKYYYMMSPM